MELEKLLGELKSEIGDAMGEPAAALDGILTAVVKPDAVIKALKFLQSRKTGALDMLTDLTAVDWMKYPESGDRFELVYLLTSSESNARLRIKTRVSEMNPRIQTATSVYKSANWLEREVYDFFGIKFDGHPDLRRIMMWEDFEGHPLRKDFPTRGYHPVERTPKT